MWGRVAASVALLGLAAIPVATAASSTESNCTIQVISDNDEFIPMVPDLEVVLTEISDLTGITFTTEPADDVLELQWARDEFYDPNAPHLMSEPGRAGEAVGKLPATALLDGTAHKATIRLNGDGTIPHTFNRPGWGEETLQPNILPGAPDGTNKVALRALMRHEIGHVLGLGHVRSDTPGYEQENMVTPASLYRGPDSYSAKEQQALTQAYGTCLN